MSGAECGHQCAEFTIVIVTCISVRSTSVLYYRESYWTGDASGNCLVRARRRMPDGCVEDNGVIIGICKYDRNISGDGSAMDNYLHDDVRCEVLHAEFAGATRVDAMPATSLIRHVAMSSPRTQARSFTRVKAIAGDRLVTLRRKDDCGVVGEREAEAGLNARPVSRCVDTVSDPRRGLGPHDESVSTAHPVSNARPTRSVSCSPHL